MQWCSPPSSCLVSRHLSECLGLSSASAALSLGLALVSNQVLHHFWLSLGSVLKFSPRSCQKQVRYISWICTCSAFRVFGKWVLCLNCYKWQTLLLYNLLSIVHFVFVVFLFFRPQSPCLALASGWLLLPRSRLILFPAFRASASPNLSSSASVPASASNKNASTSSLVLYL